VFLCTRPLDVLLDLSLDVLLDLSDENKRILNGLSRRKGTIKDKKRIGENWPTRYRFLITWDDTGRSEWSPILGEYQRYLRVYDPKKEEKIPDI